MAERQDAKQTLRDLVVRLGVVKEANADQAMARFQQGIGNVQKFLRLAVMDIVAYNAASSVLQMRLGDRALAWNIDRLQKKFGELGWVANTATEYFNRFRAGLGLINEPLVEMARGIERQAAALKMSVKDTQTTLFAFEEFGLTSQDMTTVLMTFGQRASDALDKTRDAATGASAEFKKLGISVEELKGRNPVEVLELVAEKFSKAGDQKKALRSLYALLGEDLGQVFGASLARRLVPAMQSGAKGITNLRRQAMNSGMIIDDELVENGARLAETFSILARKVDTFWQSIGLELAPAVEVLVRLWTDLVDQNRDWIQLRVHQAAELLTAALRLIDEYIRTTDWDKLWAIFGATGILVQAIATMTSLAASAVLARMTLLALSQVVGMLWKGLVWLFPALTGAVTGLWEFVFSATAATFAALGFSAGVASILAGLFLLAMAAAMFFFYLVPLALAVEDFIVFLRGGNSVLGKMIEYIREFSPWIEELGPLFVALGRWGRSAMYLLLTIFREFAEFGLQVAIRDTNEFMDTLAKLLGQDGVAEMIRAWTRELNALANAMDRARGMIQDLDDGLRGWYNRNKVTLDLAMNLSQVGFTAALPGGASAPMNVASEAVVRTAFDRRSSGGLQLQQMITVNGRADQASGQMVGDAAARGAREALDGAVR